MDLDDMTELYIKGALAEGYTLDDLCTSFDNTVAEYYAQHELVEAV